MITIFDVETTGLPLWREPSEHPGQPHLCSLAAIFCEDDGTEITSLYKLVKPDGWTIPADVTAIHGITNERAMDEGVPERDLLEEFLALAGPSIYRVAYNEGFDARLIRIALHRFGDPERVAAWEIHPKPRCAMKPMINIVNLPPTQRMVATGRTFAKTPKLAESYQFMFGEMMEDAHDALADTRATKRLWFEMLARGIVV